MPRLEKEVRLDKGKAAVVTEVQKANELLQRGTTLYAGAASAGVDMSLVRELQLMTAKPFIYVFNVDEDEMVDEALQGRDARARRAGRGDLPRRQDRGRAGRAATTTRRSSCSSRWARTSRASTSSPTSASAPSACRPTSPPGPKESRAWTIPVGATAPQAAGVIHTDFQRGFIKAEVVSYDELVDAGSMAEAKARGKVRIEGKDYVMADGDVVEFRFNV